MSGEFARLGRPTTRSGTIRRSIMDNDDLAVRPVSPRRIHVFVTDWHGLWVLDGVNQHDFRSVMQNGLLGMARIVDGVPDQSNRSSRPNSVHHCGASRRIFGAGVTDARVRHPNGARHNSTYTNNKSVPEVWLCHGS